MKLIQLTNNENEQMYQYKIFIQMIVTNSNEFNQLK